MSSQKQSDGFFEAMPKVDLHRHLEGSLRFNTLVEVARAHRMDMPHTGRLRSLVQVHEEEPYTSKNFLSKFETLRLFYRTPEIIGRVTREAIADAAADHVRYLELRFTPVALSKAEGFSLAEVIDWVIEGRNQAKAESKINVNLIVSVNRHESPKLAEQAIGLAIDRKEAGVVGVDLCGNETDYSAIPFAEIFQQAKQEGMHITVHAGEWGGANNVSDAIQHLGAERIGHGIRVLEDPSIRDMALERGVTFEVCITSNYQSGVIPALGEHPLPRLLSLGHRVTLCTDDPSISQITLSNEFKLAHEDLRIPLDVLQETVRTGIRSAFMPEEDQNALLNELDQELCK